MKDCISAIPRALPPSILRRMQFNIQQSDKGRIAKRFCHRRRMKRRRNAFPPSAKSLQTAAMMVMKGASKSSEGDLI